MENDELPAIDVDIARLTLEDEVTEHVTRDILHVHPPETTADIYEGRPMEIKLPDIRLLVVLKTTVYLVTALILKLFGVMVALLIVPAVQA
jgi:hypothetical protein